MLRSSLGRLQQCCCVLVLQIRASLSIILAILVETSSLTKLCAGDEGEKLGIVECKRNRPTAALRRVLDQAVFGRFKYRCSYSI